MIFITLTQPLRMGVILIVQTLVVAITIYYTFKTTWLAIMLILVITGGLMVSFIYVCTLVPAEPTSRAITWFFPRALIPAVPITALYLTRFTPTKFYSPLRLYTVRSINGTITIILILLITLLVIRSNTVQIKSPLRSFY